MWSNIRLHVSINDNSAFDKVCDLAKQHGLEYMNFPVREVGSIFIIHPHSPNDRMAFQGVPGVTILPHPHCPSVLSNKVLGLLGGHSLADKTSHEMWRKLNEIHPHPALHPDA